MKNGPSSTLTKHFPLVFKYTSFVTHTSQLLREGTVHSWHVTCATQAEGRRMVHTASDTLPSGDNSMASQASTLASILE